MFLLMFKLFNSQAVYSGCLNSPLLDEFARDGPDTRSWQHIPVKHTELQPVFCLFQLLDHLLNKINVFLAVTDEGIKQFWYLSCKK